ncbi:MAG: hypothetical protein LBU22_03795 [Dysgonamonadaceae bacterium]|jgi:hypothetical protein|nr:hypothetical protein [Dysgonamonadaceae bacterium]
MDLGLGYMGYHNQSVLVSDQLTFKGGTVGLCWSIGYDIGLSQDWALGFQLSLMTGVLSQYKLSNGTYTETIKFEKEQYENLAHINLSIGLRFNK